MKIGLVWNFKYKVFKSICNGLHLHTVYFDKTGPSLIRTRRHRSSQLFCFAKSNSSLRLFRRPCSSDCLFLACSLPLLSSYCWAVIVSCAQLVLNSQLHRILLGLACHQPCVRQLASWSPQTLLSKEPGSVSCVAGNWRSRSAGLRFRLLPIGSVWASLSSWFLSWLEWLDYSR